MGVADDASITIDGTTTHVRFIKIAERAFEAFGRFRDTDIIGRGFTVESAEEAWIRAAERIARDKPHVSDH